MEQEGVENITSNTALKSKIGKNKYVAICYGKPGCNHCVMFKPKFAFFAQENSNIKCGFVDYSKYKVDAPVSLEGLPTTFLYKSGKFVAQVKGNNYDKKGGLLDMVKTHFN